MSADIFAREYMGDFPEPSPEYRAAYDAWRSYYEQTDAYDRGVCGPSGVPVEGWQRAAVAQNAASEYKRIRAMLDGLDQETVRQARDAAQRGARAMMTRTAAAILCLVAPFVGAIFGGPVGAGFGVGLLCGAALFFYLEV